MASEHPKITSYIPRDILEALDKWRAEQELDSRNAAVVAILADYLGVRYSVQLPATAPLNIQLRTVLDELTQICQRMDALEESISTVQEEVQSTVSGTPPPSRSTVSEEVRSAVPLTQMALAKRLGCSDKAIEKQRKQGSKEKFAAWSRDRDPDGITWTWEGGGGRGQPLKFLPVT
ncbi:MAG: hypothetical protein ICV85_09600 [Tolypothrix sp. T3-bin4]|nr:hypothetical protein [Tolypothrix sp. T3-bin4]